MNYAAGHSRRPFVALLGFLVVLLVIATLLPLSANAAPAHRPAADALCDDAVGYWTLDETSGDRLDSKGVNDLIESTYVNYATGKIDNAALFSGGTNLYHDSNASLETGDIDFTITAWVYFPSLPEAGTTSPIISRVSSSAGEYQLLAYTGAYNTTFIAHLYKPNGVLLATVGPLSSTVTAGTWYFVAFWYNASTGKLGLQVNTEWDENGYVYGESGPPGASDVLFLVGADQRNSNSLDARVDEIGIWKRLLTTPEKNTLYNSGSGYDPITCGATPTPTLSPTPGALVEISKNYIDQGGFEFSQLLDSKWDVNITNSSVRMMLGLGSSLCVYDVLDTFCL